MRWVRNSTFIFIWLMLSILAHHDNGRCIVNVIDLMPIPPLWWTRRRRKFAIPNMLIGKASGPLNWLKFKLKNFQYFPSSPSYALHIAIRSISFQFTVLCYFDNMEWNESQSARAHGNAKIGKIETLEKSRFHRNCGKLFDSRHFDQIKCDRIDIWFTTFFFFFFIFLELILRWAETNKRTNCKWEKQMVHIQAPSIDLFIFILIWPNNVKCK